MMIYAEKSNTNAAGPKRPIMLVVVNLAEAP